MTTSEGSRVSRWRLAASIVVAAQVALSGQSAPEVLALTGEVAPVHDPVVIREGETYYVFSTGGRPGEGVIPIRTSRDMRHWTRSGFVFDSLPA